MQTDTHQQTSHGTDAGIIHCEGCAFWVEFKDNPGFGFCHAEAPRRMDRNGIARWPMTLHDDFCNLEAASAKDVAEDAQ